MHCESIGEDRLVWNGSRPQHSFYKLETKPEPILKLCGDRDASEVRALHPSTIKVEQACFL